jgi:hypothetical protein
LLTRDDAVGARWPAFLGDGSVHGVDVFELERGDLLRA